MTQPVAVTSDAVSARIGLGAEMVGTGMNMTVCTIVSPIGHLSSYASALRSCCF